ncbi:MAG: D-alanyl-D-alanine carboxypeptidase [Chitinophagaceae bacterium]
MKKEEIRQYCLFSIPVSYFCFIIFVFVLASCSVQKEISRSARENILEVKALQTAHVGISIFDPASQKYLFNYQGDKYYVPASNTKLPTCYAAMKHLGDSLVAYLIKDSSDIVMIHPTGDPTFLHPDFKNQQPFHRLQNINKKLVVQFHSNDKFSEYGSGWSWDDYEEPYLAERAALPIYGNVIRFEKNKNSITASPPVLKQPFFNEPLIQLIGLGEKFKVTRNKDENKFSFSKDNAIFKEQEIPFKTNGIISGFSFFADTLHRKTPDDISLSFSNTFSGFQKVYSQPTDSFLKIMMHRSDNFFAEQSLLMVSNVLLGYMNDKKVIDTLLKSDFKDLPQSPRWADGSGLSQYNLFTPQDFIAILYKMKTEFGMKRIQEILPTGGEGTIRNYYQSDSGYIFGKTGTLSGVVAFSGFLYTKKNRLLIFSTLVNNHNTSATEVRRAVEKFINEIRNRY